MVFVHINLKPLFISKGTLNQFYVIFSRHSFFSILYSILVRYKVSSYEVTSPFLTPSIPFFLHFSRSSLRFTFLFLLLSSFYVNSLSSHPYPYYINCTKYNGLRNKKIFMIGLMVDLYTCEMRLLVYSYTITISHKRMYTFCFTKCKIVILTVRVSIL